MPREQIIEMIKNNQTDPNSIIFRYNLFSGLLSLLSRLFLTVVCLGYVLPMWYQTPRPIGYELKVTLYGLGFFGFVALIFLIIQIYTLFFLKSNMIVFTKTSLIKSLRGKVQSWDYDNITNVRQIVRQTKNSMPTYSIEFIQKDSGKIFELTKRKEFGPTQNIFTLLKTKVTN